MEFPRKVIHTVKISKSLADQVPGDPTRLRQSVFSYLLAYSCHAVEGYLLWRSYQPGQKVCTKLLNTLPCSVNRIARHVQPAIVCGQHNQEQTF